eukprot:Amastigsp_a845644_36.p2 type:complete len:106 gc:universal Amastigsp_a845644_36:857-540(-)
MFVARRSRRGRSSSSGPRPHNIEAETPAPVGRRLRIARTSLTTRSALRSGNRSKSASSSPDIHVEMGIAFALFIAYAPGELSMIIVDARSPSGRTIDMSLASAHA